MIGVCNSYHTLRGFCDKYLETIGITCVFVFISFVKPNGFNIPYDAERIHGISTELAEEKGFPLDVVLEKFNAALSKAKFVVGQNVNFDLNIMGCEFHRTAMASPLSTMAVLDTCTEVTAGLLKLPGGRGGRFKLPTLTELHQYLFGQPFGEAHNAVADVEATTRCFLELVRRQIFTKEQLQVTADYFNNFLRFNPSEIKLVGLKPINLKKASDAIRARLAKSQTSSTVVSKDLEKLEALQEASFGFCNLLSVFQR